jgi:hypothetical protein
MNRIKMCALFVSSQHRIYRPAIFALTLFCLPAYSEAVAEVITFEFSGGAATQAAFAYSSNSTLASPIITATPSQLPAGGLPSLVFRGPNGLGVDTRDPGSDSWVELLDNIDGASEYLEFELSDLGGYESASILSLTFRNIEQGGTAPVGSDDDDIGLEISGGFVHFDPEVDGEATFVYPAAVSFPLGTRLRVAPLATPKNDEFSVYSLTLNATPLPEPSGFVVACTGILISMLRRTRNE